MVLSSSDGLSTKRVIVKRIVPKELPSKPSLEVWKEFVASVKREVDFYKELEKEENKDLRSLFPECYHVVAVDAE